MTGTKKEITRASSRSSCFYYCTGSDYALNRCTYSHSCIALERLLLYSIRCRPESMHVRIASVLSRSQCCYCIASIIRPESMNIAEALSRSKCCYCIGSDFRPEGIDASHPPHWPTPACACALVYTLRDPTRSHSTRGLTSRSSGGYRRPTTDGGNRCTFIRSTSGREPYCRSGIWLSFFTGVLIVTF